MSKTVSCRLSSEIHEKLLDKCNNEGLTVNDFVKVLVQSALDGTPELALDSTSNHLDSTKKSETEHNESNIDRSNLENWVKDLKEKEKFTLESWVKSLGKIKVQ